MISHVAVDNVFRTSITKNENQTIHIYIYICFSNLFLLQCCTWGTFISTGNN